MLELSYSKTSFVLSNLIQIFLWVPNNAQYHVPAARNTVNLDLLMVVLNITTTSHLFCANPSASAQKQRASDRDPSPTALNKFNHLHSPWPYISQPVANLGIQYINVLCPITDASSAPSSSLSASSTLTPPVSCFCTLPLTHETL